MSVSPSEHSSVSNPATASGHDPLDSPVFILGMHRSGTTLLYEMLTETGHWNTLWAWHVASYDEIRAGGVEHAASQAAFSQRLADAGMETRGVDAVKAGPESKEEYCFIMDNKGCGTKLTPRGLPLFQEICTTVQGTHAESRPLLLKNPWDFGNAPVIRQLLPSARFVYIHRHPQETVDSMWRFLNQAFQEPNAYMAMMSQQYAGITQSRWKMGLLSNIVRRIPGLFIDGLISWFGKSCDAYLKTIDQVPAEIRVDITYDELCAHPNETIQRIRTQLDLPDDGYDFSSMISRRNRACHSLVEARSGKIERRMAAYLRHISELKNR